MDQLRTMKSFRILFSAVPMWMLPFAYGGPSWRMKRGRPAEAARTAASRPIFFQAARRSGSRRGRSAFIGKSVFGRFSVAL